MRRFRLINQEVRDNACYEIQACPDGMVCTIQKETRNLNQNARLYAMLTDISKQVSWPVDGEMVKITADDWKNIFSAALKRQTRMAKGLDGGVVMLGVKTSKMNKEDFSDLIQMIQAFGDEREVKWGASDVERYKL